MYCFLFNKSHIIFYFIESVLISWATVVGLASGVLLCKTVYTDFTQTYQTKSNFLVALYQSWDSKIVPSAMEPIFTVTNTWKPCSKDFQFRQAKILDLPATLEVMWNCFVTSLHLHQSSTAWLTLLLLLSCSVSFSSSLLKNGSWGESLSGSVGEPSTVTEPLSSILKNEILRTSIFYQHKII